MRAWTFLALMALMSMSLSGCLGFGDDDKSDDGDHGEHDHCDPEDLVNYTAEECVDDPPVDDGNGTVDPPTVNQLPNATLAMTGPDGILNATSYVQPGANVTFSAANSTDSDGEIALAGLTVTDSNGTRTAQLFADGAFTDVTLQFNNVGPVNVTLRVLDDQGEGVIRVASFAVNEHVLKVEDYDGPAPTGSADACEAPGASSNVPPLVTNSYSSRSSFGVQTGAQWIEATVVSGSAEIAICAPDGTALSEAGTAVQTMDDTNSTLPVNAQYYIMVLAGSAGSVTIDILVHYEPKA